MVRPDKYIRIWVLQISPRQIATIDRMVFFSDEKEFVDQKKIRQKTGSGKEIMARDLEAKKKMEKFYINAEVDIPGIGWRRQDGFSIYRSQLPQLISALQNIIDGKHDDKISWEILKSIDPEAIAIQSADAETGWKEKTEDITEDIVPEENKLVFTLEMYDRWFSGQSEKKKKEILELERCGWTKEKIYNTLNSKEYRDCFK